MANLLLRNTSPTDTSGIPAESANKEAPLTNREVDSNFISLNEGKLEKDQNLNDLTNKATARNNLAEVVTSGQYLRGDGTNVQMSAIQAGDVPTLNQNTTGTASNVTGTVAVANGGTGATTDSAARTNLGATTVGSNLFTLTNPGAITFLRLNADNSVDALSDSDFRNAIGAGVLDPSSNIQVNSLGVGTAASGTTGEILATGDITTNFSDDRLKDQLGKIENALENLLQLNTFYYKPNNLAVKLGYNNLNVSIGLSAQEIQKIYPEVIKPAPIDDQYLTIQYEKLVPVLISAIQDQQKIIKDFESRLLILEKEE